jgi:hypothetical protein
VQHTYLRFFIQTSRDPVLCTGEVFFFEGGAEGEKGNVWHRRVFGTVVNPVVCINGYYVQ